MGNNKYTAACLYLNSNDYPEELLEKYTKAIKSSGENQELLQCLKSFHDARIELLGIQEKYKREEENLRELLVKLVTL